MSGPGHRPPSTRGRPSKGAASFFLLRATLLCFTATAKPRGVAVRIGMRQQDTQRSGNEDGHGLGTCRTATSRSSLNNLSAGEMTCRPLGGTTPLPLGHWPHAAPLGVRSARRVMLTFRRITQSLRTAIERHLSELAWRPARYRAAVTTVPARAVSRVVTDGNRPAPRPIGDPPNAWRGL